MAEVIDDAIPARGYQMLPVVGLGGSAETSNQSMKSSPQLIRS